MPHKSNKKSVQSHLLRPHGDSMFLYGKNSIETRLAHNPQTIKSIYIGDTFKDQRFIRTVQSHKITILSIRQCKASKLLSSERSFSCIAQVQQFQYAPLEDLLLEEEHSKRSLLFLDGIEDPVNLGAILRICACFGSFAIVIPKHRACRMNDTVLHVASGAENFVPVAQVNPQDALFKMKEAGYWIAGGVLDNGEDIHRSTFPFPICLVLGAEGSGIRSSIRKQLDKEITLPMKGAQLSFNVAMSAAVFCYEIDKQRNV